MKKQIFLSLITAFLFFGMISCQKEKLPIDLLIPTNENVTETTLALQENITTKYFYDGQSVEEGFFTPGTENSNTLVLLKLNSEGEKNIEIHGFSTVELYLAYGDTHGMDLRLGFEIENHLREYAISSGAVAAYEATGVEPQSFIDYSAQYIASKKPSVAESRSVTMMREDCSTGATMAFATTSVTMHFGTWSDRVSSYFPFMIYGPDSFFDKKFYDKKLATIWNFGWSDYCFNQAPGLGFMNKRTSSWGKF
jgi:hypothetical protein